MYTELKRVDLKKTLDLKNISFTKNLSKEEFHNYKKNFFVKIKNFYKNSSQEIKNSFLLENDGLKMAYRRSNMLDQIISVCLEKFSILSPTKIQFDNFSIVATGGYGRQELAPFSDIDILFLHNIKDKKILENNVKPFLHILWDLNLRVGYATRTPKECIFFSKKKTY